MTPKIAPGGEGLDLAPCPFCGSAKALYLGTAQEIYDTGHEHAPGLAVVCDATQGGCGATGGFETSPTRAKASWNRRSQVSGGEGAPADLRERLAALCHEQWSGWMKYLFGKCEIPPNAERGDLAVIPEWAVQRWKRQMETPYASLSEKEKDSDRTEADRFLALLPAPAGLNPHQVMTLCNRGLLAAKEGGAVKWRDALQEIAYVAAKASLVPAPAVPDALTWTREKPTVEGWYWCRYNDASHICRVQIFDEIPKGGEEGWMSEFEDECEFCGPIPEPREAPPAPMNEGEVK